MNSGNVHWGIPIRGCVVHQITPLTTTICRPEHTSLKDLPDDAVPDVPSIPKLKGLPLSGINASFICPEFDSCFQDFFPGAEGVGGRRLDSCS